MSFLFIPMFEWYVKYRKCKNAFTVLLSTGCPTKHDGW